MNDSHEVRYKIYPAWIFQNNLWNQDNIDFQNVIFTDKCNHTTAERRMVTLSSEKGWGKTITINDTRII